MSSDQQGMDVHVLVVSSAQGRGDTAGPSVAARLEAAGHHIADRFVVSHDHREISEALSVLARSGAAAVIVVGGTTVFEGRVAIEAAESVFTHRLAAFGPLCLHHALLQAGSQALWLDGTAGLVGTMAVFVIPPSADLAPVLVDQLIAPQLSAAVGWGMQVGKPLPTADDRQTTMEVDDFGPDPVTQDAIFEEVEAEVVADADADEGEALPPPSKTLGSLGRKGLSFSVTGTPDAEAPPSDASSKPTFGWMRAVYEVEGELLREKREELPQPVERLAPLLDILHQAGESAVLKLPSGVRYSLWGFPDLRRPTAKVIALGWGQPLCEILALHRFPVQTGLCIDEAHGLLPRSSDDVASIALEITGRVPPDPGNARLFAVEGDAVYLLREGQVSRWDGRREVGQGSPKQALVSLALGWSQR